MLSASRVSAFLFLLALFPASAHAQLGGPEVIKGRVTDDSTRALIATVTITRGPDRLVQSDTTDSAGNFRIRFEQGTGDYLIYVSAAGFNSARRRVQRQDKETELTANFVLSSNVAQLEAVRVSARRPVRATNGVGPTTAEAGGNDRWAQGVVGQISPTIAGDLNATASTMSNVTMTSGGISVLGSGPESNLTTLNGMGLAAGAIPRAARTETRVTGATFDPTRGGFAGANIDVRLGPGSRDYQRRNAFFTVDAKALQFSDPFTQALGTTTAGLRGSFGADGELIRKALTYNVAIDLARNSSDPATLVSADADALLRAGVSPDSVARLVALANPIGVSLTGSGIPLGRQQQAFAWLGRLDDTRDTMSTRALTTYLGYTKDGALGFGPLAAPSVGGERKERTMGAQITLGTYVGEGRRILTETRLAASSVKTDVTPYRAQPSANVLVRSPSSTLGGGITGLNLGGGALFATDDSRWTMEGSNETVWMAGGRRHRFKALLWGRADGLQQAGIPNALGTFNFNSIEDFSAGRPSSFTRTLSQPERNGSVWNTAGAIAHQFAPTQFFRMLYGARIEGNGFMDAPAANPALESALGVKTGAAPGKIHVSPRAGFTYTFNRDRDNGSGTNQSPVGRFYRSTVGVINGGIGEFRDMLRPGILADASAATGLPGATSILSCVGTAVPTPDWSLFASDASNIPSQCRNGSGPLGERAPSVTLIDPGYQVPSSWRASVDFNTSFHTLLIRLSGLGSMDLHQPGIMDANFSGVQKFSVQSEGGRPVFVTPSAIDPQSGSVSAAQSRISDQYGNVNSRVSDLRGYGGQFTLGLSPDVFKFRNKYSLFASLGYTAQWSRRQFRGFDGAGFGDPREKEWAASANDARNVIVVTTGFSIPKIGTITLFGRGQSGLPFTPQVRGDVNGDGRFGDRPFIPAISGNMPGVLNDGTALTTQLLALVDQGSPTARTCITENAGKVVGRNACRGPWTESLNIQWRPRLPAKLQGRLGDRFVPSVYFQNVLAGIDQAMHGSSGLRGWGSQTSPDPVLLIPRGFNVATNQFKYDVNPRFADTRGTRNFGRDPFRIVIDFSMNLSVDYDLQELRRAIEPVRTSQGWQRRSADSLAAFYLSNTSSIHKLLIQESDSLFLSKAQLAGLRRADSVYSERVRAIYIPLGQFLASSNGNAGKAERDSVNATQKQYWKIFWEQPEVAGEVVTPSQRELIPMFARMIATPMKDREHSRWQFGSPVKFSDKPTPPPAPGGTSVQIRN